MYVKKGMTESVALSKPSGMLLLNSLLKGQYSLHRSEPFCCTKLAGLEVMPSTSIWRFSARRL
jgi:hypothetical protein